MTRFVVRLAKFFRAAFPKTPVRRHFCPKLILEHLEARCTPSTLVVNSIADNTSQDQQLTLREALAIVNSGSLDGAGHPLTDAERSQVKGTMGVNDTIIFGGSVFSDSVPDTIALSKGELAITSDVTILGPGAKLLSISGKSLSRVFHLQSSTTTIAGLTIRNGRAAASVDTIGGGGILAEGGKLTLRDCAITGNAVSGHVWARGGGVAGVDSTIDLVNCTLSKNAVHSDWAAQGGGVSAKGGALTLTHCTISNNKTRGFETEGGGVFVWLGTLAVTNSTVSRNDSTATLGGAGLGGGIIVRGSMTLTNCTIANNLARGMNASGGGLYVLLLEGGEAVLSNCTIAGNSAAASEVGNVAGGGVMLYWGKATLINCTLVRNAVSGGDILGSGGIAIVQNPWGTTFIGNSIIANNIGGNVDAPYTSLGYNLIDVDLAATLGPLRNNGGPTETIALLPGSPAIDAGNNALVAGITIDQRGLSRVVNGIVDIGAFEARSDTAAAALQIDPCQPEKMALFINGTEDDDVILVVAGDVADSYRVTVNGVNKATFTGVTGRIFVSSFGGNDNVVVSLAIKRGAVIDGGAGNDTMHGGSGDDLLVGDEGDDALFGRVGRDLLIGGVGVDRLWGNAPAVFRSANDGDILIGGTTTLDTDEHALCRVSEFWVQNTWPAELAVSGLSSAEDAVDRLFVRTRLDVWFAESKREVWAIVPSAPGRSGSTTTVLVPGPLVSPLPLGPLVPLWPPNVTTGITGTVLHTTGPDSPLGGALVTAILNLPNVDAKPFETYADIHGKFTLALPPGPYLIYASDPSHPGWSSEPQVIQVVANQVLELRFTIFEDIKPLPVAIAPGVRGIALIGPLSPVATPQMPLPDSQPLPGAIITVQPAGGGAEITRTITDDQGRFQISLAPGDYRIVPLYDPTKIMQWGTPQEVHVSPNQMLEITVDYDSGIC